MVERRAGPRGCVVTRLAGGGECRRYVVGAGCTLVLRLVTRVAIGRRSRISAADVTTGAGD